MIEFLTAIQPEGNGRFTELRAMRGGEVRSHFIPLEQRDVVAEAAMKLDAEGHDVYFGVLPRMSTRGRAEECVSNVAVIWSDIDNKNVGGTHLASLMRVGALNLTPSIIVDSGNGIHAYWLLSHIYPFSRVQPAMKGLQAAIGSDAVHDAPRVLRLPATYNHKECNHRQAVALTPDQERMVNEQGFDSVNRCKPVRLLHFEPERQYRLSDFDDFIPSPPVYQSATNPTNQSQFSTSGWEPSHPASPPFPEGTRNASLTRLAGIMVSRGVAPIDTLAALLDENNRRCVPPLPPAEVERIARSVSRYA